MAAAERTTGRSSRASGRAATTAARLRYERGCSAYLEALDAQRTLNDSLLGFIRNRQAYVTYTVGLMNARGGGWAGTPG